MERVKSGDQDAARVIVERYRHSAKRIVRHQLRKPARRASDSDDILQDVWIAFLKKAHDLTFSCPRQLTVYLQRLAVNKAREANRNESGAGKRRHDRADLAEEFIEDPAPGPDCLAETDDEWRRLLVALPTNKQWGQAFDLYRRGFTNAEIARELGVSERTVERLWQQARAAYSESRGTSPDAVAELLPVASLRNLGDRSSTRGRALP